MYVVEKILIFVTVAFPKIHSRLSVSFGLNIYISSEIASTGQSNEDFLKIDLQSFYENVFLIENSIGLFS